MKNTVWVVFGCYYSNTSGFSDKFLTAKDSKKEADDFVEQMESERVATTPLFFIVEEIEL